MKKCILFTAIILLVLAAEIGAQTQIPSEKRTPDYPELPRVSAYEAYLKYKDGKAIILQAGGENYAKRHILGAYNLGPEAGAKAHELFRKLPKRGIEIFTYCY